MDDTALGQDNKDKTARQESQTRVVIKKEETGDDTRLESQIPAERSEENGILPQALTERRLSSSAAVDKDASKENDEDQHIADRARDHSLAIAQATSHALAVAKLADDSSCPQDPSLSQSLPPHGSPSQKPTVQAQETSRESQEKLSTDYDRDNDMPAVKRPRLTSDPDADDCNDTSRSNDSKADADAQDPHSAAQQPASELPENSKRRGVLEGIEAALAQRTYDVSQSYSPSQDPSYQRSGMGDYMNTDSNSPDHTYRRPSEARSNVDDDTQYTRDRSYDPPLDPSIGSAHDRAYFSESSMAEALQRENRSHETIRAAANSYATSYNAENAAHQYETYGGTRDRDGQIMTESDRKRRKRVFSNRTKTGCMTCRKRKKKCDELHPECNNCLRGGFVCEGYSIRNTWPKPSGSRPQSSVQFKRSYEGSFGRQTSHHGSTMRQDDSPTYANAELDTSSRARNKQSQDSDSNHYRFEQDQNSPLSTIHNRRPPGRYETQHHDWKIASGPSSRNRDDSEQAHPSSSAGKSASINVTVEAASEDKQAKIRHADIVSAAAKAVADATMASTAILEQPRRSQLTQSHVQAAAQAALSHAVRMQRSISPHLISNDSTEREKMLSGEYYSPRDPVLIADREQCVDAIWLFNNAANPAHQVRSPDARLALFRNIPSLQPSHETSALQEDGVSVLDALGLPQGSCGEDVIAEAPFYCDYGYNLSIGDHVSIGPECRISDSCAVSIGARTILGAGVKLFCSAYHHDYQMRQGSLSAARAKPIVIEEDCWIGPNTIILPGVRIGRGSNVAAASVVLEDVPECTSISGNPAKIMEHMYNGTNEA